MVPASLAALMSLALVLAALPALLPAVLAEGHLKRLDRARYNVFDPRLGQRPGLLSARLAVAAFRGRY